MSDRMPTRDEALYLRWIEEHAGVDVPEELAGRLDALHLAVLFEKWVEIRGEYDDGDEDEERDIGQEGDIVLTGDGYAALDRARRGGVL